MGFSQVRVQALRRHIKDKRPKLILYLVPRATLFISKTSASPDDRTSRSSAKGGKGKLEVSRTERERSPYLRALSFESSFDPHGGRGLAGSQCTCPTINLLYRGSNRFRRFLLQTSFHYRLAYILRSFSRIPKKYRFGKVT